MKINKLNYINKYFININNIGLILILCNLFLWNYCLNIIILLIFRLINIYINNYNEFLFKFIILSIIIYYLLYIYIINNIIYMDSTEYLTLYNNIYIKGLNSLVENYGELIAYAVGVKLSSIYLKTLPIEPTFYFHFGLGVGPSLDLTVHQESYDSPVDSNFKNYILLTVEKVEDHIIFLKDMVPFHHKHYKTSKMTNMENNITIISGDALTNINVVNIHCSLEPSELYVNYFNIFENLIFNFSSILYFLFLTILFIIFSIKFINFIKFIRFITKL
uniref:Uncharacterized protein n=1 Tax=Lactifluus hygrophoroides TaxID=1837245 RepID=A0A2Z4M9W5_9AGAM|nr:hypothetical protein [Lactifluus hygrophoroides]AWX52945.1 hypothetical protein [Lactifluus hygrophoroides]